MQSIVVKIHSKWQMLSMLCSRNRDLPLSSFCLCTFYDPYSSFLNFQFLYYLDILEYLKIKNLKTEYYKK